MADITACDNKECPDRMRCHRFTCKKNQYSQAFFSEDVRNEDGSCNYFWDNKM